MQEIETTCLCIAGLLKVSKKTKTKLAKTKTKTV